MHKWGTGSNVTNELVNYLQGVMDERHLSQRAFALYAKVASSTISRIMRGLPADHDTLAKLADYLDLPIDSLYRMAGILPPEDNQRTAAIRLIEHLFKQLPEDDQAEIIEIARLKIERRNKEQE